MKAFLFAYRDSLVFLLGISVLLSLYAARSTRAVAKLQRALVGRLNFNACLPESGSMRPIL
jgi:hypothetical protein